MPKHAGLKEITDAEAKKLRAGTSLPEGDDAVDADIAKQMEVDTPSTSDNDKSSDDSSDNDIHAGPLFRRFVVKGSKALD